MTHGSYLGNFAAFAFLMVISCWAMTDSTSISILLNSSKQHQAPDCASPEKNLPIILKSRPSEQLKTTHCIAKALARSLVVSVFPVPAGPAGAPPKTTHKFLKDSVHKI